MSEWVAFVEEWVESQNAPPGEALHLARVVLENCVETGEITYYQAYLYWCAFYDSERRGYR